MEEITRALQREESTPCPTDVPTSKVTSSAANQTQLAPTVNKTKDFDEKASKEKVGQTTQILSGESHKEDSSKSNVDSCIESKVVLRSPPTSRQLKDEIILHISDISDEEEAKRDWKLTEKFRDVQREKKRKRSDASNNDKPALLKEEYVVTSLRVATHKKQSSEKEHTVTKTLTESQNLKMEEETADTMSDVGDVMSEDDDVINKDNVMSTHEDLVLDEAACSESESSNEGSGLDVEVSELDAAKLLEMEMRRRALESELKKFAKSTNQATKPRSQTSLDDCRLASEDEEKGNYLDLHVSESETLDSQTQSSSGSRKQKAVPLRQHESRDVSVNELKMETDTMDIGQLLEMKLRQKALQSLLNKKKQNSTQ